MTPTDNRSTLLDNLISSENTSTGVTPQQKPPHDDRFYHLPPDLDPIFLSVAKRIYAQINLVILAANTIAAVFSISAAVSLIEEDDDFRYQICDYGNPVSIGVQCPYTQSPIFISFLVIWTIYFTILCTYKYHRTVEYWTHDLRFYFASEAVAFDLLMQVMVAIGVVLTLISGLGGFYYVIHNGTTTAIGSIVIFIAVNLVNLKALANGKFDVLATRPIDELFPQPIYIKLIPQSSWKNLFGVCYHPQEVIDLFLQLTLQSYQYASKNNVAASQEEIHKPSNKENKAVLLSDYCHHAKEVQEAMKTLLPEDYVPNK
jgi:hypothetical protein